MPDAPVQLLRFRPLRASEVEARVGTCSEKGLTLLLYKDARVDMALLDEVVGAGKWQCRYNEIGGKLFCQVGVLTDYDAGPEWVWKEDVGVPSNMEATKGEASDAFKRACFKWGIGRELYTAPFIWVPANSCHIKKNQKGKHQCYDNFEVAHMGVEDGRITSLEIINASYGNQVCYRMDSSQRRPDAEPQAATKPPRNPELEAARDELRAVLKEFAGKRGGTPQQEWGHVVNRAKEAGRSNDPAFWHEEAAKYRAML